MTVKVTLEVTDNLGKRHKVTSPMSILEDDQMILDKVKVLMYSLIEKLSFDKKP